MVPAPVPSWRSESPRCGCTASSYRSAADDTRDILTPGRTATASLTCRGGFLVPFVLSVPLVLGADPAVPTGFGWPSGDRYATWNRCSWTFARCVQMKWLDGGSILRGIPTVITQLNSLATRLEGEGVVMKVRPMGTIPEAETVGMLLEGEQT